MKHLLVIVLAAVAAIPASAQSAKLEALPVVLPKPLFEGTPVPANVPNLEKPSNKPRPPFLAPAGTVNVALRKAVTSSDTDPVIGNPEWITDGNKAGTDGTYVELKPGLQNIVIDLETKCVVYAIVVWHYHKEARSYAGVVVQTADDPDFISNVQTLFNNDAANETGNGIGKNLRYVETNEGKLIDAKGVETRYLRLFSQGSNASSANHYIEVEVYGKPLP
jgi:hypothetical protein